MFSRALQCGDLLMGDATRPMSAQKNRLQAGGGGVVAAVARASRPVGGGGSRRWARDQAALGCSLTQASTLFM